MSSFAKLDCGHAAANLVGGEQQTRGNLVVAHYLCQICNRFYDLVIGHVTSCLCSDCPPPGGQWVATPEHREAHEVEKCTTIPCTYCKGTMLYVEMCELQKHFLYCEVVDCYIIVTSIFGEWLLTKGEILDEFKPKASS